MASAEKINGGPTHEATALVAAGAAYIWSGFKAFRDSFESITRRAQDRFEACDWSGMRADTLERLALYEKVVLYTQKRLERHLGPEALSKPVWIAIKAAFTEKADQDPEGELACTFYNSVNRRIFQAVGVEPRLEFIDFQPESLDNAPAGMLSYPIDAEEMLPDIFKHLLSAYNLKKSFIDLDRDCVLAAQRLARLGMEPDFSGCLEMLPVPFFRDTHAYLIGRLCGRGQTLPLVLSLGSHDQGLVVDAVMQGREQIRVLFSFSRAYFHVQTGCAGSLVRFFKQLMPQKRIAELYISLGFHKHGKTELYKDLLYHRQVCSLDRFEHARGQPGMVMIAFNMSQDDLIYKLIRDRFAQPKKTTREKIMQQYDYVFKHDRAGRLVDVQTFENLSIETCCFTPELLEEIRTQARETASVAGDQVTLHHVYVERRVTPLDVFLASAPPDKAQAVVIDYGQAIKDLAQINIFPGDLLIKNFGVTRLGRVVFYDYDEVCPLTQCRFRRLPQAQHYEDALEAEPWFAVAENDVFPEEFMTFLGLPPTLQQVFRQHHADLLQPDFWLKVQDQIKDGQWIPILPYAEDQRL